MNYTHRDIVFDELRRYLKTYVGFTNTKISVLEIGAGEHSAKQVFEEFFEQVVYTTIDNESEYKSANNYKMEADDLDFNDSMFDFVFMSHVSEHFENPIMCFKEARRVLKKDGILFNASPYPCVHQILLGDPKHLFVLSEIQLLVLIHFVGFDNIEWAYVTKIYKDIPVLEQDWNVIMVAKK